MTRTSEIESRLAAATPGPWPRSMRSHADNVLISNAPEDIRFLLDALKVATEALERIAGTLHLGTLSGMADMTPSRMAKYRRDYDLDEARAALAQISAMNDGRGK